MRVYFEKNLLTNLIIYKLKEITQLLDVIKSNELDYASKFRKTYNFSKYALANVFEEIYTTES